MTSPAENWKPGFNPWLIAVAVAMGAFMEVLDTSIANVALPHLAGDLGASNDESTWVLTSYLVSNAIVLPISGWLATAFGRKRFFLMCIFMFTTTSLLCGIAPSLPILILFRVIQGAGGGGLQPMAQAILADTFPPENATGNYVKVVQRIPVRINLDAGQNGDRRLRPGMSVAPTVYVE